METTKESLLMAEDSKTRDAILFEMMVGISEKIDECNKIDGRVKKCESNIAVIKGVGATITVIFSGIAGWFSGWFKFG